MIGTCFEEMGNDARKVQGEGKGMAKDLSRNAEKANSTIKGKVYKVFDSTPSPEYIPDEMKKRDQWVWWKVKEVDGKTKKIW